MDKIDLESSISKSIKLAENTTISLSCLSTRNGTANLQREIAGIINSLFNEATAKSTSLALDEAIRNSYEHGNLGISFQEKRKLLENEKFEAELDLRENAYKSKKINVKISLSASKLTFVIEDEGDGFDWKNRVSVDHGSDEVRDSLHGRGLTLMRAAFDKISYNDIGNSCTLEKFLN